MVQDEKKKPIPLNLLEEEAGDEGEGGTGGRSGVGCLLAALCLLLFFLRACYFYPTVLVGWRQKGICMGR